MSAVVTKIVPAAEQAPTPIRTPMTAPSVALKPRNDIQSFGRLLTVGEVATILRVHPNRVYELAARKTLPSVRVGRLLRFHIDALHEWIRSGGTQDCAEEYAVGLAGRRG
jgi:excisionase family DNA binding protein